MGANIATHATPQNTDFGEMLKGMGISATLDDEYYYRVGEPESIQGWILYVSVIKTQLEAVFKVVCPLLSSLRIPYRIVQNRETGNLILNGAMGWPHVGKVVCIFPSNDELAVMIASKLIDITLDFVGPDIPSAMLLGGRVYCRYGAHKGIIAKLSNGYVARHIYGSNNRLVQDVSKVPFVLPTDVFWPFGSIAPNASISLAINELLPGYKILRILREHPRGNVMLVTPANDGFASQLYVIKQARPHMWSDDYGRDMRERLRWQAEIHKKYDGQLPLPKYKDYFEWKGSEFLVMEYVSGLSDFGAVEKINNRMTWWPLLEQQKRISIVNIMLTVATSLKAFHDIGYVHRDVTPENFMITDAGEMKMIDIELAFNFSNHFPDPPFELGTEGFMSPQQEQMEVPNIADDLYGLGATLLSLITLHSPYRLGVNDGEGFRRNLTFLIGYSPIEDLIFNLLSSQPENRPSLQYALNTLLEYRQLVSNGAIEHSIEIDISGLREFIQKGINGLVSKFVPFINSIWRFPENSDWKSALPRLNDNPSFGKGIAGVLHVLEIFRIGRYQTEQCESCFKIGHGYLWDIAVNHWKNLKGGFHSGAGGIAVGLSQRREKGGGSAENVIQFLLSIPTESVDVNSGVAGQGLAIMECYPNDSEFAREKLIVIEDKILSMQISSGVWIMTETYQYDLDFYTGNSGVLFFLLRQWNGDFNYKTYGAISHGRKLVVQTLSKLKLAVQMEGYPQLFKDGIWNQFLGGLKILIECYKVIENKDDAILIHDCLSLPDMTCMFYNPSLENGLSALGMIYLDAYKVFNTWEYLKRAEWIGAFLINTSQQIDQELIWRTGKMKWVNASLLSGSSGFLLFLNCLWDVRKP